MRPKYVTVLASLLFAAPAWALPIANPAPTILGDDIEGTGLFSPEAFVVGIEVLDLGPLFAGSGFTSTQGAGFGGAEFGFFFASDPSTRIAIFDTYDQDPDPNGAGSVPQVASIDFLAGEVHDVDAANSLQSSFAPGLLGPIGFYLTLAPDLVNFFGFNFDTIYSVPGLNLGGEDMSAAYPLLNGSGYLLGFAAANPYSANNELFFFGASIATNVTAVTVPEPGTGLLFLTSVILLLSSRSRRRKNQRAI